MTKATTTFQLDAGTRVHIASCNIRRERHGDDNVPAVDIGMRLTTTNDALAMFDAKLKAGLYQKTSKGDAIEAQGELDLPVSDLPALRFPRMKSIHFDHDFSGYTLLLTDPSSEQISLVDCDVDKFAVQCLEGGSIVITFRVQSCNVDANEFGALAMMLDTDVEAMLTPPEKPIDIADEKNGAWPFRKVAAEEARA